MNWYENLDDYDCSPVESSKRTVGAKISGNSKPKLRDGLCTGKENGAKAHKSASSKRKAKANEIQTENAPSRRRLEVAQGDCIEKIVNRGHTDDIDTLHRAILQHDDGHGSYITTDGFLLKLPDGEDESSRMYHWCIDLGFSCPHDSLLIMKLPSTKFAILKAAVNKNVCARQPQLQSNGFFKAVQQDEVIRSKSARRKNYRKATSKAKNESRAASPVVVLKGGSYSQRASRRRSVSVSDMEHRKQQFIPEDKQPATSSSSAFVRLRVDTLDDVDELSDSSSGQPPSSSSRRSSLDSTGKRKSPGYFGSPSPTIPSTVSEDGTETVTREFNSIAIFSSTERSEKAVSSTDMCPLVRPFKQRCYREDVSRLSSACEDFQGFSAASISSVTDHREGRALPLTTTTLVDVPATPAATTSSSILSPPSSIGAPPPIPGTVLSQQEPSPIHADSCADLFDVPVRNTVLDPTSILEEPRSIRFSSMFSMPLRSSSMTHNSSRSGSFNDGSRKLSRGHSDEYRSDEEFRGSNVHIRRQNTEPYLPPKTPFRDTERPLSQNDIDAYYTPQAIFPKFHTSGQSENDWGTSCDALSPALLRFFETLKRHEDMLQSSTTPSKSLPSAIGIATDSTDDGIIEDLKSIVKAKKKKAMLKRMSSGRVGHLKFPSPGSVRSKRLKKSKPAHRKSSIESLGFNSSHLSKCNDVSSDDDDDAFDASATMVQSFDYKYDDRQSVVASVSSPVTEMTFRGVIIGGVYENCFDNNVPVVSAPSSYDKRVVGVSLRTNGGLELRLYLPKDKSVRTISLGSCWSSYRTSTGGYLVSKSELLPHRHCVCYYLPKHPLTWAASTAAKDSREYSVDSIITCEEPFSTVFGENSDPNRIMSHCQIFSTDDSKIMADGIEGVDDEDTHSEHYVEDDKVCRVLLTSMDISQDSELGTCTEARELQYNSAFDDDNVYMDLATQIESTNAELRELHIDDSDHRCGRYPDEDITDDDSKILDANTTDWNNPSVVSCVLAFLLPEECMLYASVSKAWALEYYKCRARELSYSGKCNVLDRAGWVKFMTAYSSGVFLSQGACKDVFRVQKTTPSAMSQARHEAVSVMDINDLQERGMEEAITQELEISMLSSALVSLNICPNLIQIYSIFESKYPPSKNIWKSVTSTQKSSTCIAPNTRSTTNVSKEAQKLRTGRYQYIRMEYCSGGDLEEMVRKRGSLEASLIRNILFQMCFSLYACRERIAMRHYDIKLLNFFCTDRLSVSSNAADIVSKSGSTDLCTTLHFGFGDSIFNISIGTADNVDRPDVVKLADFGTSIIGVDSLGSPIGVQQFTTLENTPPEYLFLGSHAREAYSADTFCLGLSYFHLLTGEEPYEEHLKSIRCPAYLQKKLRKIWMTSDSSSPYAVIREVMESLESGDDADTSVGIGDVLYDTLYRYFVLFGFPSTAHDDSSISDNDICPFSPDNPVWCAVTECLGRCTERGRITKAKSECIRQFEGDCALWSLESGSSGVIVRVRDQLERLGEGATDLLTSMVHLDPAQRCSMHDAILSPMFYILRMDSIDCNDSSGKDRVLSFMHYKTSLSDHGVDLLPLL